MRIDGITTCVGQAYAVQLARALPIWLETLDSLVVVSDGPLDDAFYAAAGDALGQKVWLKFTNVFTQHGAAFNKGAALNVAYDQASPSDWALAFDADIIPPPNWRDLVERSAVRGHLHSCCRTFERPEYAWRAKTAHPLGFFQLWHTSDPCSWRWPLFPPHYPCAGGYDAEFAEYWPRDRWLRFDFAVEHQGQPGVNWFGQGTADKTIAWRATGGRFRNERLPIEAKAVTLNPDSDPEYAASLLRELRRTRGPFGLGHRSGKGVA